MINDVIAAVGLEVEGPFVDVPKTFREGTTNRIGDFHEEYMAATRGALGSNKGGHEAVSTILKYPKHILEFFDELQGYFMEGNIKEGMALHVHFSFTEQDSYVKCFSKGFAEYITRGFIEKFESKAHVANRLTYTSPSGNRFCSLDYPENYFKVCTEGKRAGHNRNRYYAVNFWGALDDHKTFEFRVPPSASIPQMIEYVEWVINAITSWVKDHEQDGEFSFEEYISLKERPITIIKNRHGKTIHTGE